MGILALLGRTTHTYFTDFTKVGERERGGEKELVGDHSEAPLHTALQCLSKCLADALLQRIFFASAASASAALALASSSRSHRDSSSKPPQRASACDAALA